MAMADSVEKHYSTFWINCIIGHISITLVYLVIFWVLYYYHYAQNRETPKDRLYISTNTISTIHCIIVFFGAIISFFYDELYKIDNMVLSQPGMLSIIYVLWNSYMMTDLISHIVLYSYYSSNTIKRRYDILIHHIVSYLVVPLMEIPIPIYGWFALLFPFLTELSSIFLNLEWFGKHYNWNNNTIKNMRLCFLITWFCVRLPALWAQIVWSIIFWDDIVLWPYRSWITGVSVIFTINLLHIIWSTLIIKGLCSKKKQQEQNDIDSNQEEDNEENPLLGNLGNNAPATPTRHPLDSPSIYKKVMNRLFYVWVFKLIKIGKLIFKEIPNLPSDSISSRVYCKWSRIYNERKEENKSTSTMSMIYHTEKCLIFRIMIPQIIGYGLLFICFYIFKQFVWPSIDDGDMINIVKYAFIIFIIMNIKSVMATYSISTSYEMRAHITSCLYQFIFYKTLSLHLTEKNKNQILSIIGSDIASINMSMYFLLNFAPPTCLGLIASIIILYLTIGVSSIFGIIFMIFIGIPFQIYAGYKLSYHGNERMKYSDCRVQLITELIHGIRVAKVSCYQLPLMHRISGYRKNELKHIKKRNFYFSLLILANFVIPAIILFITLMIYCFVLKNGVNSNFAAFMIMVLTLTQMCVRGIPASVGSVAGLFIACRRIDSFHHRKSVDTYSNDKDDEDEEDRDNIAIEIDNATFVWMDKITGFYLNNISMKIKRGKLVAVIGKVGSGKTSFIQSILHEMKCVDGEIKVNLNEIVYCSQTPYIRNNTLRENILMELPYNKQKYKQCIAAAALLADLKKLPNYDLTLIGDEGVTLSGGQKMRISFARTLYRKNIIGDDDNNNKNKIYLFDDPLSSVDIYVGKHMFFNGIYKNIMNRNIVDNDDNDDNDDNGDLTTCIMVINSHLHLLRHFDEILIIDEQEIKGHCSVNDLYFNENNTDLLQKYQHLLPNVNQIYINKQEEIDEEEEEKLIDLNVIDDDDSDDEEEEEEEEEEINDIDAKEPNLKSLLIFIKSSFTEFDYEAHFFDNKMKMAESENVMISKPKLIMLIVALILCTLMQCAMPICDLWILYWNKQIEGEHNNNNNNNNNNDDSLWYIIIWCVTLSIIILSTLYSMYLITNILLKGAKYTHCKSLYNILRANTLFFDITPRGDIMNRFTTDTNMMDTEFVDSIYFFMTCTSSVIGYFIFISIFIPYSLIPMLVILFPLLFYINYRFQLSFIPCLTLQKHYLSPIINLFAETVPNLDSIRAYKFEIFFINDLRKRIDTYLKCYFMADSMISWLILYQEILLNILQVIVIIIGGLQISVNTDNNNKQFIMLSCWYFLSIQQQIAYVSINWNWSKSHFISIMRLMHYDNVFLENEKYGNEIVHESKQINSEYRIVNKKEEEWPNIGNILISKLQLRYRREFNIVLNIDSEIQIKHGTKIGICGRSGSGKSSILVSIFRLFEPIINDVIIDKLNISKLGLYDLRSNLSMIPQDPILFHGNLRFNLDPFNKYNDNDIWNALKDVQLFHLINQREGKLMCLVDENGSNFSVGQKQLLCFARSILSKSKIIFMDEATSSIDKYTDNIIQKLIRSQKYKNITVICIAHRLQTIIDYDYILLLKNGKIKQYDTPQNLLSDENGDFNKLLKFDKLYHQTI